MTASTGPQDRNPFDGDRPEDDRPISRRNFLAGLGGGALGVAAAAYGVDRWATAGDAAGAGRRDHRHQRRATAQFRSAPSLQPPVLDVTTPARGTAPGLLFLAPKGGPGQYGPMIADNTGQPVWLEPLSGPWSGSSSKQEKTAEIANNFRVSHYKGKPVLTWWQGQTSEGPSRYVLADEHYRQIASFGAGNGLRGDQHEFAMAPGGTALVTFYEAVPADLSSVGGPSTGWLLDCGFQRIDIATGDVHFQWRASSVIGYWESYRTVTGQGTKAAPWDFFHINSVDMAADGNYLISARHTWAVYKIDQTSGTVLWRLNGKQSDYHVGRKASFSWQHDARCHQGNAVSVFDDGAGVYKTSSRSRGLILTLDESAMTAQLDEQYLPPGRILAWSQGSTQILSDDHVVVGWGSEPFLSEYAHGGRLLFAARLPEGSCSYRAFRFPWTGKPLTAPSVALERHGGSPRVYASWNGATEVASWQVLAGSRRDGLRAIGKAGRSGFETTISAAQAHSTDRYFAVAALDAKGGTLARSEAVAS